MAGMDVLMEYGMSIKGHSYPCKVPGRPLFTATMIYAMTMVRILLTSRQGAVIGVFPIEQHSHSTLRLAVQEPARGQEHE